MKRYWIGFSLVMIISFAVLGWVGTRIYREKPPIPEKVVTQSGQLVYTKSDIQDGQNIWQAMGGMEIGSVWGHGSYVAPDWTADWLHKEILGTQNFLAVQLYQKEFIHLSDSEKSSIKSKVTKIFKTNTYDVNTGVITIDDLRYEAIK